MNQISRYGSNSNNSAYSMPNGACIWVSHNALFQTSQTRSVNDSMHQILTDYIWKFQWKNCIMGMLLTCPIIMQSHYVMRVKAIVKRLMIDFRFQYIL